MYGAILGDVIGSRFEFKKVETIPKDFDLIAEGCRYTDDTVMTIAVAEALMYVGKDAGEEDVKTNVVKAMQYWGRKNPHAGYGGTFRKWLMSCDPKPYRSFGNGSAMRVSSVGWLYDSLERTREVARWTAEVTHDHPEGIKGAECTAAVIYLLRSGEEKEAVKEYVEKQFGYQIVSDLSEIRNEYNPVSCMDSLPKALSCFFLSETLEETIRKAVCLGEDTDTVAAIAGSMAEAYYVIPDWLREKCDQKLSKYILSSIRRFEWHHKASQHSNLFGHQRTDRS